MEWIIGIIIVLIIVSIAFYFIKNVFALVLVGLFSFLLFNVFFVWNGEDVVKNLYLDKILSEENAETIEGWFNNFDNKREEHSVIDTEAISENTKNLVKEGANKVKDKYNEVDKQKIINDLKELIKDLSKEDANKILDENKNVLDSYDIDKSEVLE